MTLMEGLITLIGEQIKRLTDRRFERLERILMKNKICPRCGGELLVGKKTLSDAIGVEFRCGDCSFTFWERGKEFKVEPEETRL